MPNVEITQVRRIRTDPGQLVGFGFDSPAAGEAIRTHSIQFDGWVAGTQQRVTGLELKGPGLNHTHVPIGLDRPDIADSHPDIPIQGQPMGFRTSISTLGLPREFMFRVNAVLVDKRRIPLVQVIGKRERVQVDGSRHRPLLVTSMGRTGSSLVMKLLEVHPEVVVYPMWRTEPKIASYWADVMRALADPRSHLQPMTSIISGQHWWLGEGRRFDEDFRDPALREWLGSEQVAEVASFCRDRIEAFYDRLAGETMPAFFAEKCSPTDPAYADVLREMFPETREIILVRDFRDTLCSVKAYSERANTSLFGRQLDGKDAEYIRGNFADQVNLLTRGWKRRSESAFLLRYEDLILESQETLERLLDYLELDSSDLVLQALLAGFSQGDTQAKHGTSSGARESIGRWRTDLDPALAELSDEVLADAMEVFGYLPSEPHVTTRGTR
jgi:hypothetical protein